MYMDTVGVDMATGPKRPALCLYVVVVTESEDT